MKQKAELLTDALHIFVLCNFAIAQPLFDLLSQNAEFFVVRNSEPVDVILLILILGIVIPTFVVSVEVVAGLFGRRVRKVVHGFVVAALMVVIALPALKQINDLQGTVVWLGAVFVGLTAAIAYMHFSSVRMFVTALLPAIVLFPGLFLFNSPIFKIAFPVSSSDATYAEIGTTAPIVIVVFDELPLVSLMDENRRIDPIRYPNFAALAQDAIWFREATTVSENTIHGVPAMFTGNYPDPARQPTAADNPHSIFTLLGGTYALNVFGAITALCPDRLCQRTQENLPIRLSSLLSDLSIVYLHVLLPRELSARLPSISRNWMDFAGGILSKRDVTKDEALAQRFWELLGAHTKKDRFDQFMQFVNAIDSPKQPTLYFLHSMLPHIPYNYLPSGKTYGGDTLFPPGMVPYEHDTWGDDEWAVTQAYQRHLLQVGLVDTLLGKLLGRLREVGMYDRSLIVVTSDHGASFRPNEPRRPLTKTNFQDIMPVPLIIKAPNQRDGRISDRNVETIDILPTIADILGIKLPWPVDGHSALDHSVPERKVKVVFLKKAKERLVLDAVALKRKYVTLHQKLALFGSGSRRLGLFKIGPNNELVGQKVTEAELRGEAKATIGVDSATLFTTVNLNARFVPAHITGYVQSGSHSGGRLNLAIAVNGTIQAVTQTSTLENGVGAWSAVVDEASFRAGHNGVEVFMVSGSEGKPVLKRASSVNYFLLEEDQSGNEVIKSSNGTSMPVVPHALVGVLDVAEIVPRAILIFLDGKLIYSGRTDIARPDVAKHYGKPAIRQAGFGYLLPSHLFSVDGVEARFFAVSKNGVASELYYPKGYKWRRKS
jgi:hypothetical protein